MQAEQGSFLTAHSWQNCLDNSNYYDRRNMRVNSMGESNTQNCLESVCPKLSTLNRENIGQIKG